MKLRPLLLSLIALLIIGGSVKAQVLPPLQPEQDACNALTLCGNVFFTPYSYSGIGNISDISNTPCSGAEVNSVWFRLKINTGGIIVFTITPVSPFDDYDFAVVDISTTDCNNLQYNNVKGCNFNNNNPGSNVNGVVGVGIGGSTPFVTAGAFGNSFCSPITVGAGDELLIMVNNFGNYSTGGPSSGFTIDFTGSTATFFDAGPPTFNSIGTSCNSSQQITLTLSEPIKCNSIATNGSDFALSPSGTVANVIGNNCSGVNGYTTTLTLDFASALPAGNYTLTAQNGIDGNTLLDLCDNPMLVGHSIQFTIPPYVAPSFVSVQTPACSEMKIKLAAKVRCDSIAKDGSDFSISGPQASSVIGAYGVACDTMNFTDTVVILLSSPLQTDGTYTITAKKGSDNNTIMDSCGLYQAVGDAITININSYDGQLVTSSDQIVCRPEYIQLQANNTSTPPFASLNCDADPSVPCSGVYYSAYVGRRDSSTATNSPFSAAFQDGRSQYLFRASELKTMGLRAGSIRALDLKVTQQLSNIPFNDFTIKVGCTPLNELTGNFVTVPYTVYTSPGYSTTLGWNNFDLTTPFNWDGISNLVVEICYDNSSASTTDFVAHQLTPFNSAYRRYGNNLTGCNITSTQGTQNLVGNLRPRIRFHICEPPAGVSPYTWSPGFVLSDSTSQNPLAYVYETITYKATTIDKWGCAHRDSTVFTVSSRQPELQPMDTTICFGEKVMLHAKGGLNYSWLATDPTTLSCLNCAEPVANTPETTSYSVIISDQYNCADTLSMNINVKPLPAVSVTPEDTLVKYGTRIRLIGSGAYLYHWYPPNSLSDPNDPNPFVDVTEPITFYLTGIHENGCRNTDSVKIMVDYSDPVFIPDAFTPNGDGRNDVFRIGSLSFQKLQEFRVFNRWGQEVFSTNDPKNGWDGTLSGRAQDNGVYKYIIRLAYPDGKVETYKGDITLIR